MPLAGPLFEMRKPLPDGFDLGRLREVFRWHPDRKHLGGPQGGGDTDTLGDESLYMPSRLGSAEISPQTFPAGGDTSFTVTITRMTFAVTARGITLATTISRRHTPRLRA